MKTLTTTFHHTTNYGAVLQSYALQHTIQELGHENVILEVVPPKKKKSESHSPIQILKSWYLKYLRIKRHKQVARLQQSFIDFHKAYLQLTKPYHSMHELLNDPEMQEYDCLITGSDQVWNMSTVPDFIDSRLLLFGSKSARRYSYAASIEELNYTDEQKKRIVNAIMNFNGVSLREESACNYVESFSGIKCKRVIDPVFLLTKTEWMKIAKEPRIKGPYILCYQVQSNSRIEEVADQIKKRTGYPIISICNGAIRWMKSDYSFHDVSVEEFIGFYNQAAYIVSASFHGVAMGIVFDKPVYAMVKQVRSNRIREIMNLMGFHNYIVDQNSNDKVPEYNEADLQRMKIIKEKERNNGLHFIKSMFA